MKILICANVPLDPHSGAAGTVYYTNEALKDLGHEVTEVWNTDIIRKIKHGNLHFAVELPRSYWKAISVKLETADYDVVQISQPYGWYAAKKIKQMGFSGVVVNRSHGWEALASRQVNFWLNALNVDDRASWRKLITRVFEWWQHRQCALAVKHFDGVIVPANDIKEFMLERYSCPSDKIRVVPHGVPCDFSSKPVGDRSSVSVKKMLYVGQNAFIKGVPVMIEALNQMAQEGIEYSMTWVTSERHHQGLMGQLNERARSLVTFMPWQSHEALMGIYDQHGIFLFPSFYEGAGKACLEAMSRGLCVVASRIGAMRDYIQDGSSGYLFDVGDAESLSEQLRCCLDDLPKTKQVGMNAHESVKHYTWSRCAHEAIGFYTNILRRKNNL